MSTKTLRKRIALVAVAALGAGVLAASPASAGNNPTVGTVPPEAAAAGFLNVVTAPSITGDAIVSLALADNRSLGLLANSTTQTTLSLSSTATMRADGEIVFYYQGSATNEIATTVVVAGGTITDWKAESSADTAGDGGTDLIATGSNPTANLNSSKTQLVVGADADNDIRTTFAVTPNSGASSVTVSVYESAALATTNAAAMTTALAGIQAGTTSAGTLKQRYLVTVATTSASGVYSAADSFVQAQFGAGTGAALAAPTTNADATQTTLTAEYPTGSALVVGNGGFGYVSFDLRDAYGVSLTGAGALVVSATNGAGVALASTASSYAAASSVTLLTTVSNAATGTVTVARPAAMANKGFSTTVTISWNGAVVGTKSFTFQGEVASMVVTPRRIGQLGTTNADMARVTYADSAGNALINLGSTATTVVSTTTTSAVTGAAIGTQGTATDAAKVTITCGPNSGSAFLGGGTAKLQLQHTNASSGTVVKSNVFDATCQGNAYSYTAGFDKTTYTPGSIATLTITFKDRDGDLANGMDPVGTTASLIVIAGAPSAAAVTIPADGDKPDSGTGLAGTKTYQFIVGSTEGDFQAVVAVPVMTGSATATSRGNSSQTNQTVAYTVKASSSAVSNADVLKAIVSLIASINKQIAALQKALLKK